jgi:SAM-dependent methyltransferase
MKQLLTYKFFMGVFYIIINALCIQIIHSLAEEEVYTYQELLERKTLDDWNAVYQKQKLPDGRTQSLNKKGADTAVLDRLSAEFAQIKHGNLLEIGSGYGEILLTLLTNNKNFSGTYVLNDLDERHLYIAAKKLEKSIQEGTITKKLEKRVSFMRGDIVNTSLPPETYDAILIARVLHFLNPTEIRKVLKSLYKACKPGGKVYVVAITPYVKRYQSFIAEYEARLKNDEDFPGHVNSLLPYVNHEVTTEKELKNIHPGCFTFFGPEIAKIFRIYGFKTVKIITSPLEYQSKSWRLDGRENILLIAQKPEK